MLRSLAFNIALKTPVEKLHFSSVFNAVSVVPPGDVTFFRKIFTGIFDSVKRAHAPIKVCSTNMKASFLDKPSSLLVDNNASQKLKKYAGPDPDKAVTE